MGQLPFESVTRTLLVRQVEETSGIGSAPEERSVQELLDFGFVILDKPEGPTSAEASREIGKLLGQKKSGHSGTLDPKVTGVLPIGLGRATRVLGALLPAGKEYRGIMHLHDKADESEILRAVDEFRGEITQLPPVRSSVKREERQREIYYIDLHEIQGRNIDFTVGCQAGTYIRKLCHDIGERLGTGAHMKSLVRTRVGPFSADDLVGMDDVERAGTAYKEGDESRIREIVIPAEHAVGHLPAAWCNDIACEAISYGIQVDARGVCRVQDGIEKGDRIAMMTLKGELAALAEAMVSSGEMIQMEKGYVIQPRKVFCKRYFPVSPNDKGEG